MARCKGCGAEIDWIRTRTGKNMPVDPEPVFVIIEPVAVPVQKDAPSKAKLLVIFTFLAGCCAAGWVLFGDEYWKKLKENL